MIQHMIGWNRLSLNASNNVVLVLIEHMIGWNKEQNLKQIKQKIVLIEHMIGWNPTEWPIFRGFGKFWYNIW